MGTGVYEGKEPYTRSEDNGSQDEACGVKGDVIRRKGGLNSVNSMD